MKQLFNEHIASRLQQLFDELYSSSSLGLDYHDRLREFKGFCESTYPIAMLLDDLPSVEYDFDLDWREMPDMWPQGLGSYGLRWNGICQMVEGGPSAIDKAWMQLSISTTSEGLARVTDLFVRPICNYILDSLEASSSMLYSLLRYKRRSEWFNVLPLRAIYDSDEGGGEEALDQDIRKFLFDIGIDYPFSQVEVPRGRVDIVAGLESADPLVLEVKVWDSNKNYRKNRLRDGVRQALDYATKLGKDRGYLVVFNLDDPPLNFVSDDTQDEWPPRIEHSGRTLYCIDVHLPESESGVSITDKGKPVKKIEVDLRELFEQT